MEVCKVKGNEYFTKGEFKLAIQEYTTGLEFIDDGLANTLRNNRAACYLKIGAFESCVNDCTEVLQSEPRNVKALFRRAQAFVGMKKIQPAFADLKLLLEVDKTNKAAVDLIQKVRALALEANSNENQTIELIDSILSSDDDKRNEASLLQILRSVAGDEHLARSICDKDTANKLWKLKSRYLTSIKILAKMTEYSSCTGRVLDCVSSLECFNIIRGADTYGHADVSCRAAVINMLWHMVLFEDQLVEKNETFARKLSCESLFECVVPVIGGEDDTLKRAAVDAVVRLCSKNKTRAILFINYNGLDALASLISRNIDRNDSIHQAAFVLGKVFPSLENDNAVKTHSVSFCKSKLYDDDVHNQAIGAACLDAVFVANRNLGFAVVSEEKIQDRLQYLSQYGSIRTQFLVVDIYSYIANSEDGRSTLAGDCTDALKRLSLVDNPDIRGAASVTLAKLNAIEFDAATESGMETLASIQRLLLPTASKPEHAKGVEGISFLITNSDVKNSLCSGKAGIALLKQLIELADSDPSSAKQQYAYGLAFIFENLTLSEEDKKREKLREMEVTAEQWEQFEKLTKNESHKPGQHDPPENVRLRIQVFVESNGVSALRALVLNGASDKACESIARTFCNIASVQQVRSKMLAQGSIKVLEKLTHGATDPTRKYAAWSLARVLITTDPHLLKDNDMMDAIVPIVHQVRHGAEELLVFESCMALTNIATVSMEAKQKLVLSGALPAFEYAQFSDNLMVRRSATEAISNMLPAEEVVDWLCKPEKLKLWLLFCEAYDEDQLTSTAATGALANIAMDSRLPEAITNLKEVNGCKILIKLASCGLVDIEHRAIVTLVLLIESWPENAGAKELSKYGVREVFSRAVNVHAGSPIAEVATEGLAMLG